MFRNQKGNVFVYILIAVGLFGALMFVLSKSSSQNDAGTELSEGESKIAAGEIIAYAASATNAIAQMQQTGATVQMIDFMLPADTHFEDAPTIYKLFHPDGGGLNYKPLPAKASADDKTGLAAGYYIGRFNNIQWTPTTAQDVVFTAYEIKEPVCKELNKKVAGISTIPTVNGDSLQNLFVYADLHTGTNSNFTKTNCAACEEISALCVTDGAGKYAFYSILEAE
jgi:hypothetical protein